MTTKDTSEVGLMQEANDALGDSAELRRRLDEQGYIFLRQIMARYLSAAGGGHTR